MKNIIFSQSEPLVNPVRPDEWEYYLPLEGSRMFELGGKVNSNVPGHEGDWYTYKSYFTALGYDHVSVDQETTYGSLIRDLRTPLWPEFGQFDMVCNIGTSEHVTDQEPCWRNIHHLTKQGGLYVGQCPAPGGDQWWWHGLWYPTEGFYEEFAELNGWEIERMARGNVSPRKNLYVRMRKVKDLPFLMPAADLIYRNVQRHR